MALLLVFLLACQSPATGDAASAQDRTPSGQQLPPPPREDPGGFDAAVPPAGIDAPVSMSGLAGYDLEEPLRRFDLPGRLDEVSGLAIAPDGRLFAHDDERGRVHEIDPVTGEVGKRWDLGSDLARDDFEGITIVDERFFLVASSGRLYEFREGEDEENVNYRMTDVGLGDGCEIEGLDYDAVDRALLFACKTTDEEGWIVIHRLSVDPAVGRLPSVRIDRGELDGVDLDDDFEASAVVVLPGGTFLLASAPTESLLEVDRSGRVLAGVDLRNRLHPQPEGLAVGPDGILYVADEENENDAYLTAYGPSRGNLP